MQKTQPNWHLIDLKDQVLGRVSVEIAHLLMGKGKPEYQRHSDNGDFVVAVNAKEIKVTGGKEKKKIYYHHTGYPQGLRNVTFAQMQEKDPGRIISHAVTGMLPNNKLRPIFLKRLYIYPDTAHPYQDHFKKSS